MSKESSCPEQLNNVVELSHIASNAMCGPMTVIGGEVCIIKTLDLTKPENIKTLYECLDKINSSSDIVNEKIRIMQSIKVDKDTEVFLKKVIVENSM